MLLISADQKEGVHKVPINEEYDQAVGSITSNSKKAREFYHLNEVAFEDLIVLVDHESTTGNMHFILSIICKTIVSQRQLSLASEADDL